MASKCDKCEKVKVLQAKIERLQLKIQRLQGGEPIRKVHFDIDGQQTACGFDFYEHDVDYTENINEVTCGKCRRKWEILKNQWNKEQKEDERTDF